MTYILIFQGVATLNIISGSVGCVVKNGNIISHIDELTQDSFMEVETGNVIIHIPAQSSRNFRYIVIRLRQAEQILHDLLIF